MAEKTKPIDLLLTKAFAVLYCPENITEKILERFEKEETVITKSGQRVTDSFRKSLRSFMGLKEDYTTLSREEKITEISKRIADDFKAAREEIKGQNPVDYLLDRALDPLDPMNVVYTIILNALGAEVDWKKKTIRLSKELMSIFVSYPSLESDKPVLDHKKEEPQ